MKKYSEVKIYIDKTDTKDEFKRMIRDFKDGDEAVRSILFAYRTNPEMFKIRFL